MNYSVEIVPGIHWLGVNDHSTHLFERMWPLPEGVAYNSYLIADEKTALIDTVADGSDSDFIGRIKRLLGDRQLNYLVINHMEPDHSGSLPMVHAHFPGVKFVGNRQTKRILERYYPDLGNFIEIKDGEELALGKHTLRFYLTPWVHWPETMMTYVVGEQILFSGDAFGSFGALNGAVFDDEFDYLGIEDEMRRYYSNIVGKYGKFVQRALARLEGLPISAICATHGPVWRSHAGWVVDKYDKWSRQEGEPGVVVAISSMYGATLSVGEYMARRLSEEGIKNIAFHDLSSSHLSFVLSDIWKYTGLVLGSVTYNTALFPPMEILCNKLADYGIANKKAALFGSGSWGGGALRELKAFTERANLEVVGEPFEMVGRPTKDTLALCDTLAAKLAEKILEAK